MMTPMQNVPWLSVGSVLGEAVTEVHCLSLEAFVYKLRDPRSLLRQLLQMAWGMQQNPTSRRSWPEVMAAVVEEPRPRWMQLLLQDAFGMDRLMRHRAAPCCPCLWWMRGGRCRSPGRQLACWGRLACPSRTWWCDAPSASGHRSR